MAARIGVTALLLLAAGAVVASYVFQEKQEAVPPAREEVVFWHFWGGKDRVVVENVVHRFNDSQDRYFVRAVAMPGNNLDVKLFLAVTGGDPPDLVNQDDPIVADWAARGALTPIDELASPEEMKQLRTWLFPAARRLTEYDGRLYALCNGLDIRALYYNRTLLEEHGLGPPHTLAELDEIAAKVSVVDEDGRLVRAGYLPNPDRLWAWGVVFGGEFYDPTTGRVTADSPQIESALRWMVGYSRRFGASEVANFRPGGQTLPGKTFALLPLTESSPHGPYATLMDGQWRVRELAESQAARRKKGLPVAEYGVCPLPPPPAGRRRAGWVNGNFFLVPRGADQPEGAWEFMKFWSGFGGHEAAAAKTCVAGGWIPVSQQVVDQPAFQSYLSKQPLFAEFVALAGSENQFPIPVIPGAPFFKDEINNTASHAMLYPSEPVPPQLQSATRRIEAHLARQRSSPQAATSRTQFRQFSNAAETKTARYASTSRGAPAGTALRLFRPTSGDAETEGFSPLNKRRQTDALARRQRHPNEFPQRLGRSPPWKRFRYNRGPFHPSPSHQPEP
jgi:multiple sugar transport system substrate-binding protein